MGMGRKQAIFIRQRNGRAGKDAGKVKGLEMENVSGSGCVFCLNPGVRV
jgi:hypothetical protein